ncbi:synaptic vesicle 2-related protein-like [Dendronephthya gigantea]|uniref:synaptic vesicle 2-related protein-like n=1 Tax=Dendronephthya gigantea TaxID=151771 RepID=UPI001069572A|nr:synaptic vesicle 2-related protein-like [Dendronephthya gigantea]
MEQLWTKFKGFLATAPLLSTAQSSSDHKELKAGRGVKDKGIYSAADEEVMDSNAHLLKSRLIDEILDDIGLRFFHWELFAFLSLLVMTCGLGTAMLSAILPRLKSDWNIPAISAGVLTMSSPAGKIIGATFCGWVSDKYGRKPSFIAFAAFILVSAFVSVFSTSYYWLWIGLFFIGFGTSILVQCFVMVVELFPTRCRAMFSVLLIVFWTLGFLLSAVVSMELSVIGYHWALATVCFPSAIFLIGSIIFLPESPHFYLAAGEEQKALNILQDLAPEMDFTDEKLRSHGPETQRADFTQLFRTGYLKITICACIAFFNIYQSHYDLIYTASDVAGSQNYTSATKDLQNMETVTRHMYAIMVWMNVPEFVIIIATALVCYVFTVKRVLLTVTLCTLVLQIVALFVVNQRILLLVVIMISRSLLASAISLLLVFASRVYPTEIRSMGTGACAAVGRLGTIAGPFIFETWFTKEYFNGTVFNIAIVSLSFIAIVLLPEQTATSTLR